MFFNREFIPAVPIREEQRLSEEEELARELKREARIFFPDKKLPDFDEVELPPLPKEQQGANEKSPSRLPSEQKTRDTERERYRTSPDARYSLPDREERTVVLKDHDAVCREEDSMWRKGDDTFSHHEIEAARLEAEQISKNKQQMQNNGRKNSGSAQVESSSQIRGAHQSVSPRLNKHDLKRGIRLLVILDKPRGLTPWKEDNF